MCLPVHLNHVHELYSRLMIFYLTLVPLSLGLLEQDLAHRFNISIATVSHICITWIKFLNQQLSPLITWPSQELIDAHMPAQFINFCPTIRVILDYTPFFTEVPSSMSIQSLTYSSYKHLPSFSWHFPYRSYYVYI